MIPYGQQDITQTDIDAVVNVLKSEYLTQGPVVQTFEASIAATVCVKHAVAVNSATSALHIACLALGLGPGDWIWTSPITFVASANCGLYCGAQVDFVDIDPQSYNLCPVALEAKLIVAEKAGNLPKIVIPVHLCGQPCDMLAIYILSQKYGFKIIEDASHAIGGKYKGEYVGSCTYSDITVFSFHPVKIITTAEGGMAVTNSGELARKLTLLRSHGITRDPTNMTEDSQGPWYYQQVMLGFNYRMNELQAALGVSQLERLGAYVSRRHVLANQYIKLLEDFPVTTQSQQQDSYSSLHLFVIRLELAKIGKSHLAVFEAMRSQNIGVNLHYIPVHTQPYYRDMGFKNGDYPNSESYYSEAISLPIYQTLSDDQQFQVVSALSAALMP